MSNYCNVCDEVCLAHPTVCTTCGSTLTAAPADVAQADMRGLHDQIEGAGAALEAVLEMTGNVDDMRDELTEILGSIRGQVQDLETRTRNILAVQQQQLQNIPALMQIPQSSDSKARPTSAQALADIPRIILNHKSTVLREATLQIEGEALSDADRLASTDDIGFGRMSYSAIVGEFGPSGEHHFKEASLVLASPLSGKDGLSESTVKNIEQGKLGSSSSSVVVFFQRGEGLTFVQKALMAQKAGASAVIIGNNTSLPWPYVMKDSKKEAEAFGLTIPVIMVKEADANKLIQQRSNTAFFCNLQIASQSHDCVVCCDQFKVSETIIQLPVCGHIFHEDCALAWLKSHNTCPYCRRELPTDDEEYENERRREQRTHAGSAVDLSAANGQWSGYYG